MNKPYPTSVRRSWGKWLVLFIGFVGLHVPLFGQTGKLAEPEDQRDWNLVLKLIKGANPQAGFDTLDQFIVKYITRDSFDTYIPLLVQGINYASTYRRYLLGEKYYHQGISLLLKAAPARNERWRQYKFELATAYSKILLETGKINDALTLYQQTIDTLILTKNRSKQEDYLLVTNIPLFIRANIESGRLPEALRYYDLFLEEYQLSGQPDHLLLTRINRASALRKVFPDSAQVELADIVRIMKRDFNSLLKYVDRVKLIYRMCHALDELSLCYLDQKKYEDALACNQESRALVLKQPFPDLIPNLLQKVKILNTLGRHEEALTTVIEAKNFYQQSLTETILQTKRLVELNLAHSECLRSISEESSAMHMLDTVEQKLVRQIEDPFGKEVNASNLMLFIPIYLERSLLHEQVYLRTRNVGHLKKFGISCKKTSELLHQLQSGVPDAGTLVFLNDYGKKINQLGLAYSGYSGIHHSLDDAIYYGESGKTILLDQAVRKQTSAIDPSVPREIQDKDQQLQLEIARFRNVVKKLEGDAKKSAEESLNQRQREREALLVFLKKEYPNYYEQRYERTFPPVATLRKALSSESALLSYSWQDDVIYGLLVTKGYERFVAIPVPKDLGRRISAFRSLITNKSSRDAVWGSPESKSFVREARYFYNLLMEPFGDLLPKRLLIIPDGILAYLPFDCLLKREPSSKENWASLPYVIRDHAVSSHFSLSTWHKLETAPELKYAFEYAGFAPDFSEGELKPVVSRQDIITPLLYSREEVEHGLQLMGGKAWFDQDASLENFRRYAGQARIIHLATHGKANDRNGDESFIAFANQQIRTLEDPADSLLVRDIYLEKIPSALVILSACETGIGEILAGEGIIGLHNGFIHAGVRSLLSTLWNVDDRSMASLIVHFLQSLKEGYTKDEALQHAKLALMEEPSKSHPYYWSATVQQGNLKPLYQKTWPFWAGGIAGICLLGLGMIYLRKRRA